MPESAIKFGSYEGAKRALAAFEGHKDPTAINPYSRFVAGGIGGMISQYVNTSYVIDRHWSCVGGRHSLIVLQDDRLST